MKIYWTLRSIPELADLPGPERRRLWRACYRRTWRDWRFLLAFVLLVALLSGAMFAVGILLRHNPRLYIVCQLTIAGVWGALFGYVVTLLVRPHIREARGDLRRHDVE